MSEHLPECPVTPAEVAARNMDGHPRALCICDRLRACEQRVQEEIDREDFVLNEGDPFREAYRAGYSKGVRDAHESTPAPARDVPEYDWITRDKYATVWDGLPE